MLSVHIQVVECVHPAFATASPAASPAASSTAASSSAASASTGRWSRRRKNIRRHVRILQIAWNGYAPNTTRRGTCDRHNRRGTGMRSGFRWERLDRGRRWQSGNPLSAGLWITWRRLSIRGVRWERLDRGRRWQSGNPLSTGLWITWRRRNIRGRWHSSSICSHSPSFLRRSLRWRNRYWRKRYLRIWGVVITIVNFSHRRLASFVVLPLSSSSARVGAGRFAPSARALPVAGYPKTATPGQPVLPG